MASEAASCAAVGAARSEARTFLRPGARGASSGSGWSHAMGGSEEGDGARGEGASGLTSSQASRFGSLPSVTTREGEGHHRASQPRTSAQPPRVSTEMPVGPDGAVPVPPDPPGPPAPPPAREQETPLCVGVAPT